MDHLGIGYSYLTNIINILLKSILETQERNDLNNFKINANFLSRTIRDAKPGKSKIGRIESGKKRKAKGKFRKKGKRGNKKETNKGNKNKKMKKKMSVKVGKGKGNRKALRGKKGKKKTGNFRRGKNQKQRGKFRGKIRTTSSCNNISCLNNLLQVLKIDKDTVANFLKQKKRLESNLNLMSSKSNKSSKVNDSLTHLALALGGELALRNSSPVCGGRYNNTVAQEVGCLNVNFSSILLLTSGTGSVAEHDIL